MLPCPLRRLSLLCFSLCLLLAATASAATAQTWSEYRPAGAGYRVEMPGTPKVSYIPVPINGGTAITMAQALVQEGGAVYIATHADYDSATLVGKTPQQILIDAQTGIAKGNTLRSEKSLAVGGLPAREFVVEHAGNVVLVMRSVMHESTIYQIAVAMVGGTADRAETRRFIDSFTLVPR